MMRAALTDRIGWSEALGRLVVSLLLVLSAIALHLAIPALRATPYLYSFVALLLFSAGVLAYSKVRERARKPEQPLALIPVSQDLMTQRSESWQKGFNDGYAWYTHAKEMGLLEQMGGFGIPNKPYRSGDEGYNAGVADGIAKARAQKLNATV